jgi:hypothetical protein
MKSVEGGTSSNAIVFSVFHKDPDTWDSQGGTFKVARRFHVPENTLGTKMWRMIITYCISHFVS